MTWLLLLICGALVSILLALDKREQERERRRNHAAARDRHARPSIAGLVNYLGCEGQTILLESPRGVELALDGDTWNLDDAMNYLDDVDQLS